MSKGTRGEVRRRRLAAIVAVLPLVFMHPGPSQAEHAPAPCAAPPVALGLDAYRSVDKLSYLELGDRVFSATTADPGGTNADYRHVVRVAPNGERVLLDETGPGVVTFMRMQESYGAPWRLHLDGQPTTTVSVHDLGRDAPTRMPASAMPYPLSLHPDQSEGSSVVATAIPYRHSMRWGSVGKNGNFYSIGRRLPLGSRLPTWTGREPVDDVVSGLRASAAPGAGGDLTERHGTSSLEPGRETTVALLSGGPRQIRELHLTVPRNERVDFGNSWVRMYWDGESRPSVEAPLKFLAGVGAGVYQPDGRPLVSAWPVDAGTKDDAPMDFRLFWPMPFHSSALLTIERPPSATSAFDLEWQLRDEPFNDPANWWGTFHATYTDVPVPVKGEDMTFLDVAGSGRIVGTVVNFGKVGPTLEGDPRFYLDGSRTPQVQATGTEEWGLGGNYWRNGHQTTLPLGGMPSAGDNPPGDDVDGAAFYRFLIADSIPFSRAAILRWEHGHVDDTFEPYRAAILWYGTPAITALRTDRLTIGDARSRDAHDYNSPGAHRYTLNASYGPAVHSPLWRATGTATTGTSTFRLRVDPRNTGTFLRRTLDYGLANQRAEVYVEGHHAGTWYTAGSFRGRDVDGHVRRWLDQELPLPASLTAGRSSVEVQIRFVPTTDPPNQTWTEFEYQMFSFVPPGC